MVQVTIRQAPAFTVVGIKTFIQAVDDFHRFWAQCNEDGTTAALRALSATPGHVTAAHTLGVSRVEKDPSNRQFDFYIASELPQGIQVPSKFEPFCIPAATWAIFQAEGELLDALYEEEMYAFSKWLPQSGYLHAPAPELEVYPAGGGVEFWLPVCSVEG